MDNLTIVIPYRDDPTGLTRLLKSLPAGIPAIVCNDQSAEVPAITRKVTTVINLKERGYFSGAVNAGIQACTTDVLVLNQDLWFTDNAKWMAAIEINRATFALIGDGVFGHPAWPKGYVMGTFMFMRRDAIARVGLLDGRTWPLWGATADWQVRMCRAGFRALPVAGHGWFHHEERAGSRYGAAITAALAAEPARKAEFIRTPPLVSVIIPCYNYGRYLGDVLGSLMGGKTVLGKVPGQTFTAWEAIIVDDASTDDTQKAGEAWADAWKGIRYIRHASNKGCPAAINTGIEAAHARIVTVLSADDMLEPTALEACYKTLELNPNALVYTDQTLFDDTGRGQHWKMADYDFERLLDKNHVPAGTMFAKEGWRKAGGYPTAMKWGREDWAFAVAMGRVGYCGVRVPQALYLYRRAGQSRTLRNSGPAWRKLFVEQMQQTFPDLYRGERPVGCCGGGRRKVTAMPAGKGGAAAPLRVGEAGMVLVEYVGANVGRTVVRGESTHARYEFSGQRRIGYVDKRDLAAVLAMRDGKRAMFQRHIVVVPAPAPAPAELAPAAPAVDPAPAEAVALASGLTHNVEPDLKPKRPRGRTRKNA